ncbi:MAG: hypothetical protein FJ146_02300 [Deltaproteobacteria bacterium]|nr:hypothetical protein [Deltaproteobacteria bacterium]
MAEKKKNETKAVETTEETVSSTPAEHMRREKKKSRWTLETCQRVARRFTTREEWAYGAPSSFKAATAKGWDIQCCAHMAPSHKAAAPAKAKTPAKVAAKSKGKSTGKVARSA